MTAQDVINKLSALSPSKTPEHFDRFGIKATNFLGLKLPQIRLVAKELGKNHQLSVELWETNIHEARILAPMLANPKEFTMEQANKWVNEFSSWDICDQCIINLLVKMPWIFEKAAEWTQQPQEYVKRAGFASMACLSVHAKKATDSDFEHFFPLLVEGATDNRNFVKKAVNWALRQIGKRNPNLRLKAIDCANKIMELNTPAARWIATDALRELNNDKISERVNRKGN
jgi:3-methyladenine DNA glycosylase AlkD